MTLNLSSATNDTATYTQAGWLNMPAFGSGYLEFMSRDLCDDDFEPAAALSDDANDALADLPIEPESDEGWASVANRFQANLRESFWSAMTTAIDLTPGKATAA